MSIDVVAQAKADLLAAGENLDGPCGAHKITATAAWRLRDQGWGPVHSTGSGCETNGDIYRADSMMRQDGTTMDVLIKSGDNEGLHWPEVSQDSYNIPAWNPTGPQPPANWRAPYDPGLVESPDEGGGGGTEPASDDEILDAIVASEERINEHTSAEADRVIADIRRVEEELETFAEQALKLLLAQQRPDQPES